MFVIAVAAACKISIPTEYTVSSGTNCKLPAPIVNVDTLVYPVVCPVRVADGCDTLTIPYYGATPTHSNLGCKSPP